MITDRINALRGMPLAVAKVRASVITHDLAELHRSRIANPGAGQLDAYREKAAEAKAFLALTSSQQGSAVEADWPWLASDIDVARDLGGTEPSLADVATEVSTAQAAWSSAHIMIERSRRVANAGAEAATTAEDVALAVEAMQDGLKGVSA